MKKITFVILLFAIILSSPLVFASDIFIDGEKVVFDDQEPIVKNQTTYVPLRKVFESLGCFVDWDKDTNTVYASKRFSYISLTIGENVFYVDGEKKELTSPVIAENGRTLVPLRVISEALGAEVFWHKDTGNIDITLNFGKYKIGDRYESYWQEAYDGEVIMTGRIAYPEIISDDADAVIFNQKMKEYAQKKKSEAISSMLTLAEDNYIRSKEEKTEFYPHMAELNFDITYNKDGIISVVFVESNFSGGMHPDFNMTSFTYSVPGKEDVDVEHRLGMSKDRITRLLKENFKEMIEDSPEEFYSDSIECMENKIDSVGWYLSGDGVHFYFNPYEIAPYSAGVIETVIK